MRLSYLTKLGLVFCATAIVCGTAMKVAGAADWPSKPIKAVVPVGAGSTTDLVHRAVLEQLSSQLGQNIVVENRLGAGGTIGVSSVARATPDGYTILAHGSAHTIAPSLYRSLGYDPVRDFAAVVPVGVSPSVLVVSPASGIRTIAEFVAAAKAKPGAFNFSSVGNGTATHLSAERFVKSAGISAVHIPFKGGAEAMFEVLAGRVEFFFAPVGLAASQIRDGKLIALVVNGNRRSSALPTVPTTLEAGFVDAEYPIWFGFFVPAQTPREIVEHLGRETVKALQTPKLRDRLSQLGLEPMVMTPAEFDAFVIKDVDLNSTLVKAVGLKPE